MGTGQTVHGRCLQSPGSQQEAQRGRVTSPGSHSTAARQGPRAGPLRRRRRLESGACQGEGRSGPASSRQRELPHVRQSRHRRGRRPGVTVLSCMTSSLGSAPAQCWCLESTPLGRARGPVSSCRPLPDGPPQEHTDPPPASRSQAGSQGRSRAAGDPRPSRGSDWFSCPAPPGTALSAGGRRRSLCKSRPRPHLLPTGQHTRPLSSNNVKEWCGDQGLHSTDGTMDVQGGIYAELKTAFQGPGWRPSERTCHLPSLVHGWGNPPKAQQGQGNAEGHTASQTGAWMLCCERGKQLRQPSHPRSCAFCSGYTPCHVPHSHQPRLP